MISKKLQSLLNEQLSKDLKVSHLVYLDDLRNEIYEKATPEMREMLDIIWQEQREFGWAKQLNEKFGFGLLDQTETNDDGVIIIKFDF